MIHEKLKFKKWRMSLWDKQKQLAYEHLKKKNCSLATNTIQTLSYRLACSESWTIFIQFMNGQVEAENILHQLLRVPKNESLPP